MKVFTPEQMRAFDQTATIEYSIPSIVLMENAALRVVEWLEWKFAPLRDKKVVVLCGKGNNGGDGFVIARHLIASGCKVKVHLPFEEEIKASANSDITTNYEALCYAVTRLTEDQSKNRLALITAKTVGDFENADVAVDAIFGTGFRNNIPEKIESIFVLLETPRTPIVAVDIPSALNAQTGEADELIIKADFTVTFAAPKTGMLLRDGIENCGEIWVGSIGTTWKQVEHPPIEIDCEAITRETAHNLLPHRSVDAHKGTAGRVIICGGSRGMSGAPALASTAALRVGAGLCIACVPDRVLDAFSSNILEATSHALPCDDEGRLVESAADKMPDIWHAANVVALGPGLSRSEGALDFARRVVRECHLPLIIDADALYALRAIADDVKGRTAPTILTPHPGEMAELMESDAKTVNENRLEIAVECAQKYNAFVVLKGARSVVAAPNGQTWFNLSGNAGMATGGSGDALTGTIAGLLAQLKDALDATLLGVYLHGLAGDIEYSKRGNGLIAHDIADALPLAILDLQNRPEAQSINARLKKLE